MLKRFFQVPLSSSTSPPVSGHPIMSTPHPIGDADKQRLVKLSGLPGNSQGKICVSDWSDHNSPRNHQVNDDRAINHRPFFPVAETVLDAHLGPINLSETVLSDKSQASQLKHYIRQQQRLHAVERKLRGTLNFSAIVGTTVVESAALFNAKQVGLLRYDDAYQTCQQVVRYCQDQTLAWQPSFSLARSEFPEIFQQLTQGKILHILPSSPSISSTVSTGSADTVLNLAEIAANEHRQWLTRWPGNWLLVPVCQSDRVSTVADSDSSLNPASVGGAWGIMALSLPERDLWTQEAVFAAHSITVELALALQQSQQYQALAQANQELQKLALSDGLTSLANRRRFDEHLRDEWQRLARDRQPLSLILCDLDHFKRYNDTFGHPAGDRCLIRVARALLNGPQRPADLVARYGGEEFAIILPNTDTHGAWRIAQKIHESIRALQIDHAPGNEEPYVTVTMGVSTIIPGHENTAQMLVQASDLALYHAKQQGRNRTYVNGHYNTVSPQTIENPDSEDTELDVMPAEGATD